MAERKGLRMASVARFTLFFVVALCVAFPAAAQMPYSVFVVPVVVKAPGLDNSNWVTDLSITNIGTAGRTFSAHFFPTSQANTFDGTFAKTEIYVGEGRTSRVNDVVGSWFPSEGTNTKGWLFLADAWYLGCTEGDPGAEAIIATRVYNKKGGGATYGMIVESSLLSVNTGALPSVFTGIRHQGTAKPGFRTSVGVANISTTWLNVEISLYNHEGTLWGQEVRDVKPLSHKQWPLDQLGFPLLHDPGGRLEVRIVDPNYNPCAETSAAMGCMDRCSEGCSGKYGFGNIKAIVPYVSNTDNSTGDGETVLPVIDQLGTFAWMNEYVEDHCPDKDAGANLLEKLMIRAQPYVDGRYEPPPVFRKIVD